MSADKMRPIGVHASRGGTFACIAAALIVVEMLACVPLVRQRIGHSPSITNAPGTPPPVGRKTRELHVDPNGTPDHDGTEDRPLDLATALSKKSPALPGDTIWLHAGTYLGTFTSELAGAPGFPIVVRTRPGERVTIDAAGSPRDVLIVNGSWTWFWGFEITNSHEQRYSRETGPWPADLPRGPGVTARGPGLKFINLVVHDANGGFGIWEEATDAEAYGNLVYNNGWMAPDRGHGHGIYTQNASPSVRTLRDNIIFNQFSHGIHAYGSERAALDNIVVEGNVVFNNGSVAGDFARDILVGGGRLARAPVLRENFTYGEAESNLGYAAGCSDGIVTDNYFGKGRFVLVNCTPSLADNTFSGSLVAPGPHHDDTANTYYEGKPTGTLVRVRPNRYEPGRFHVIVYNWDRHPSVRVDLAPACRGRSNAFEVRDAQNFFAPAVASGTCTQRHIELSLTGLRVSPPIGEVPVQTPHTAPEFAVFVVLPKSGP